MPLSARRTETSTRNSLTIPWPAQATFTFLPHDTSQVQVAIPPSSIWSMCLHWHNRAELCELVEFLPGGDMQIFRSLGVYRNNTITGHTGLQLQLRPGERSAWRRAGDDTGGEKRGRCDLNVVLRTAAGTDSGSQEELWRNVVSATLDAELWPQLASTPAPVRCLMHGLRRGVPVVGEMAWHRLVRFVLWLQLLLIFQRHEYRLWCGGLSICWFWSMRPWPDLAPEWAQDFQWRSAECFTSLATKLARVLGKGLLGLSDGYAEYYRTDELE